MSETNRTVTVSTKVSPELSDFVDGAVKNEDFDRPALLRKLLTHYRTARKNGLSCPHCKNDVRLEL